MFTEADFISYFSELEMLERNMRDLYSEAAAKIDDPELKQRFEGLSRAEGMHAKLLDELRQIAIRHSLL